MIDQKRSRRRKDERGRAAIRKGEEKKLGYGRMREEKAKRERKTDWGWWSAMGQLAGALSQMAEEVDWEEEREVGEKLPRGSP